MSALDRPIGAEWLALREPADARARNLAAGALLPPLFDHLGPGPAPLHAVDLGAGTGANGRWLSARLPRPQRWTLVDHDVDLLCDAGLPHGRAVVAGVEELESVLAAAGEVDLVTCAALLDLLRPHELAAVIEALVAAGTAALFSLTVTGAVSIDPPDADDAPLAAAFDAHQRRDGRLGPHAAPHAVALLRAAGWAVTEAETPWRLGHGDERLIAAWLDGRLDAAVESEPGLARRGAAWRARRLSRLDAGLLRATVGHVDLLALPPA